MIQAVAALDGLAPYSEEAAQELSVKEVAALVLSLTLKKKVL